MNCSDVLIIGAGPTGLVLALWLRQQGVKVRIIDKTSGPGSTSGPWRYRPGPGAVPPAGPDPGHRRTRPPRAGGQPLGPRRAGRATAVQRHRRRPDALPLPADLSPGRARATADRAPGTAGRAHRAGHRTAGLHRPRPPDQRPPAWPRRPRGTLPGLLPGRLRRRPLHGAQDPGHGVPRWHLPAGVLRRRCRGRRPEHRRSIARGPGRRRLSCGISPGPQRPCAPDRHRA